MKLDTIRFLRKYGMYYEDLNFSHNCNALLKEMRLGLKGEPSSVKMVPTYIDGRNAKTSAGTVIAIDAGGTNFRVALITFDDQQNATIDYFKNYPMPGTLGHMDKAEFFDTMAKYVAPIIDKSDKIGFCFSYPSVITENKDGRLIHFTKGVDVSGVDGELVGENLLLALKSNGYDSNKKIVVLNDTVATLLAGTTLSPQKKYYGNVGFILGTGTNLCYVEKNSNITKDPTLKRKGGFTIINTESGGCDKISTGLIDDEFDKTTNNPGEQRLEKMIGGAYQGPIFALLVQKAYEDGLISNKLENIGSVTTKDINDFLTDPHIKNTLPDPITNEADRACIYHIAEMLTQRAAKLAAIKITAAVIMSDSSENPCLPVRVTVDGSTFYKSQVFASKLQYYIVKYINYHLDRYVDIVKGENLTLLGAAVAAQI